MAARLVVEESFDIEGRGAAVVYRGAARKLRPGLPIAVRVLGAAACDCTAFAELLLRRSPQPHERHALMLLGVPKSAVPAGTELDVEVEPG